MAKSLVIVESPTKSRTLTRILGKEYKIIASMGHVRDLPEKRLGIKIDKNFEPEYVIIPQKRKILTEIKNQVSNFDRIFLATDPDREGEAISWHLLESVRLDSSKKYIKRVVFHEITESAVNQAFKTPRDLDMNLVNAQQARRLLDRLVGYKLSPLLWKKVLKGLSAGRVQSAALRIIVERENEILNFTVKEFWTISAILTKKDSESNFGSFKAQLWKAAGGKRIDIENEDKANKLIDILKQASYQVSNITKSTQRRMPTPPFITSTLQQEAWRRLHFTAKLTMSIAQQLYEGVEIGNDGNIGLITYMRTDSTHISTGALYECRNYINDIFGKDYLPNKPRSYGKKVKFSQEAHEAIRPTKISRTPEEVRPYLTKEQYKLYDLIWKRMIASQMSDAIYENTIVEITASKEENKYLFKASSSNLVFDGFTKIYIESRDEEENQIEDMLPEIKKGEWLKLNKIIKQKNFTEPPPRYTEATLIRTLEQNGIGRPSTYATIISTIQERDYVYKDKGKFKPTEIGIIVNELLVNNFPDIVDLQFTAKVEDDLDKIAEGDKDWKTVLHEFYIPFSNSLRMAMENINKIKLDQPTDQKCPKCNRNMVIKYGRFGKFLACSGYPDCKTTLSIVDKTGILCPLCGDTERGELIQRKGKNKRIYYGCSKYPDCNFITKYRPITQKCKNCGGTLFEFRKNKAKCYHCNQISDISTINN